MSFIEEANMSQRRQVQRGRLRLSMVIALWLALFVPSSVAFADPTTAPSPPAAAAAAAAPAAMAPAPALATHEVPDGAAPKRREFYESGWFWGALGAAAFVGAVVFFATRDSSAPALHLHVEVPH